MGGGAGGEEGGGAEPLHPLPLLVQHREPVLHVAVLVGTPTVVKEPRSGKKSSVLIDKVLVEAFNKEKKQIGAFFKYCEDFTPKFC